MAEAANYLRYVPYEEPYDHQREAMAEIDSALRAESDVLFEGACGTGKTLAALAPALELARQRDKTVVITTNVHQQMRQFVREASAIADTEEIRAVVFRGKGSMCHLDVGYRECQSLRDTTRDLVEAERDQAELERRQRQLLADSRAGDEDAAVDRQAIVDELDEVSDRVADRRNQPTCEHFYRNLTTGTDDFFAWLYDDVRTPDAIYEYADERGLCGYELLKEGVEGVDLVVCNYRHLLDPFVREQFFRWLGRAPEDVLAIFDEAHNLEDAAREHARRTLAEGTLARASDECAEADDERTDAVGRLLDAALSALRSTYRAAIDGGRETVGTDWHDLEVANDDRRDDFTLALLDAYEGPDLHADIDAARALGETLAEAYREAYRSGEADTRRESAIRQAGEFLDSWLARGTAVDTYPVVSVRRDRSGDAASLTGRAELFTCIPERVTGDLFDELCASVLMSATLRPFDVTADVLGLADPVTMAYGQQFPASRRRTYAVDGPALFARRREDRGVQETVTEVLEDVVTVTPGNTLVFFPNYAEAARYHGRVGVGTRYLDEPGTPARDLREQFTADGDGVLFTSLWGTLGEGVSYDGDDARSVVVVGVPYPSLDHRMSAIQAAYDATFDVEDRRVDSPGWYYAVQAPTVRKTRQALGRVVRSPTDFGARILLDARYTERAEIEMRDYAVRGAFPPAERAELIDAQPDKLGYGLLNFFADLDAYDGDPPALD